MTADYIQQPRMLKIATPLGEDVLLLEGLSGVERVNDLFHFEVTVRAKRGDIQADELIGELVDLTLTRHGNSSERLWNGLVTGIDEEPRLNRTFRQYTLTIRPHVWLLSQRSNCRIWLDKTSIDIANTLLSEHGVRAPDTAGVVEPPPTRHYSVQWNETDLDFLLRRLEEDGLFYWFRHEGEGGGGTHQLVIASHASGWENGFDEAGGSSSDGPVRLARGSTDRNHISEWRRRFFFKPGKRAGRDWNFETPTIVPGNETPSLVPLSKNTTQELYEFPARAISNDAAEKAMKLRNQAIESDHQRIFGASTVRWLSPGKKFTPYELGGSAETYETAVVVTIEHQAQDTSYETGSGTPSYTNRFEAVPADLPATPHRQVTRPKVEGSQIAIIAGPPGEEIHCDEYGRVKVWFPWDREARKDGSDTCWVRVIQNWAGTGWGGQIIPRIGMEAMVTYENGDPDRPIITGLAPNPTQKVPYGLPDNKTLSTFRTNTHKASGFNEMSFEDEAGRENMFFHAQKDQTTRVLNDRTKRIDRHEVASVGANRAVEVGGNQKHEIGGSMNTVVGGTGPMAMALMGAVQGLAGQTAGLLSQAGQIAGGGGPGLASFAGTLASSALGFLGAGGLGGRQGVVAGPNPGADAGTALSGSGSAVGDAASGLFPLPGIMNTIVGSFKSDTIGVARAEQIGVSKVTNVGQTSLESVGKEKRVTVGKTIKVEVGDLYDLFAHKRFLGRSETWLVTASDKIIFQTPGGKIELNQNGIVIKGLKVDIKGNQINFMKGGPGKRTNKGFVEDCSRKK